jgi:hypothetical protein
LLESSTNHARYRVFLCDIHKAVRALAHTDGLAEDAEALLACLKAAGGLED